MKFDSKNGFFETFVNLNSRQCSVLLSDLEENDIDLAQSMVSNIEIWLGSNLGRIKEYIATELINLKNDVWLDEEEAPVTLQDFIETIDIDGISASGDGTFELFFDDGDMFWGHQIEVDFNSDFTFSRRAHIVG